MCVYLCTRVRRFRKFGLCAHTHTKVCIYIYIYSYLYLYLHTLLVFPTYLIYIYIYIYTYIHMYVPVSVFIHVFMQPGGVQEEAWSTSAYGLAVMVDGDSGFSGVYRG